jgi:hypothetical protein
MKTGIALASLLLFCIKSECQTTGDTIKWDGSAANMLKIEDFKAAPDSNPKYAGSSKIIRLTKWYVENDSLFIKTEAAFVCSKSWFKRQGPGRDTLLLKHEQGHFDMAELMVRQTRKRFENDSVMITRDNFKEIINKYISEQTRNFEEYTRIYEQETSYSRNLKKQKEWRIKLDEELKQLEKYAGTSIVIPFRKHD